MTRRRTAEYVNERGAKRKFRLDQARAAIDSGQLRRGIAASSVGFDTVFTLSDINTVIADLAIDAEGITQPARMAESNLHILLQKSVAILEAAVIADAVETLPRLLAEPHGHPGATRRENEPRQVEHEEVMLPS